MSCINVSYVYVSYTHSLYYNMSRRLEAKLEAYFWSIQCLVRSVLSGFFVMIVSSFHFYHCCRMCPTWYLHGANSSYLMLNVLHLYYVSQLESLKAWGRVILKLVVLLSDFDVSSLWTILNKSCQYYVSVLSCQILAKKFQFSCMCIWYFSAFW